MNVALFSVYLTLNRNNHAHEKFQLLGNTYCNRPHQIMGCFLDSDIGEKPRNCFILGQISYHKNILTATKQTVLYDKVLYTARYFIFIILLLNKTKKEKNLVCRVCLPLL